MHVESELANIGCRLNIALEIDGDSAILDLVADGAGSAVLSRNAVASSIRPATLTQQTTMGLLHRITQQTIAAELPQVSRTATA
jgi:LysR family nitrogen assimilation transcriptional regulator